MSKPTDEIERKWLFDSMDHFKGYTPLGEYDYDQAYLSVDPEIRIRRKRKTGTHNYTYVLCLKGKGTLKRVEIEKSLTEEEFYKLMEVGNLKEEDFICKHFYEYRIPSKGVNDYILTVGLADYKKDTAFIYGEIEFRSEREARDFETPHWFGKEVTDDLSYKMCNYWKATRGN